MHLNQTERNQMKVIKVKITAVGRQEKQERQAVIIRLNTSYRIYVLASYKILIVQVRSKDLRTQ